MLFFLLLVGETMNIDTVCKIVMALTVLLLLGVGVSSTYYTFFIFQPMVNNICKDLSPPKMVFRFVDSSNYMSSNPSIDFVIKCFYETIPPASYNSCSKIIEKINSPYYKDQLKEFNLTCGEFG